MRKARNKINSLSLDGRIMSYRILTFFVDHTFAAILLLAVNAVITWFTMLPNGFSSFFDIFTIVFFPILMIVGEAALLGLACLAEIAAEMVADAICPRSVPVPDDLLVDYEAMQETEAENVAP